MTESRSFRQAIKNGRWLISGLIAGVSVGLIIGISMSRMPPLSTVSTMESSRTAALALGWDELNKICESSKAYDSSNIAALKMNLGSALTGAYANMDNKKQSLAKAGMANLPVKPSQLETNKPISDNRANYNQNPMKQDGKYADGSGPIDINSATLQQIDDVPRMSTSTASEIYKYIHEKGPIKSFLELDSIKNVGEKTIEKLRTLFHIKN